MEYRGFISATMIYDRLPINDAFRRADGTTLMGAMDFRGPGGPFIFSLRRLPSTTPATHCPARRDL